MAIIRSDVVRKGEAGVVYRVSSGGIKTPERGGAKHASAFWDQEKGMTTQNLKANLLNCVAGYVKRSKEGGRSSLKKGKKRDGGGTVNLFRGLKRVRQ